MGCKCSCLGTQKQEYSQVKLDSKTPGTKHKIHTQTPTSPTSQQLLNQKNLIKLQSLLRGFLHRQQVRSFCLQIFVTMTKGRMTRSRTRRLNISQTYTPDFQSSHTQIIQNQIGKFKLIYPQTPQLTIRKPIDIDGTAVYIGQWNQHNQREGAGVQIWTDRSKYQGYWKNDRANGLGRLIHADGDVYQGNWKDNKAHGKGKYYRYNGGIYSGEWMNDQYHGNGRQEWPDGSFFQGQYKFGKKNGYGVFCFADQCRYEGGFEENNL